MDVSFSDFGLYNIDTDYLRYLSTFDAEVQSAKEKLMSKSLF